MTNTSDERGERYADGGFASSDVFYPDPERVLACHKEWEGKDGPWIDD